MPSYVYEVFGHKLAETALAQCVLAIEASDFERHRLWADWSSSSSEAFRSHYGNNSLHWPGVGAGGWIVAVGEILEHTIRAQLCFDQINHVLVCFYYGCSRVVDHEMIRSFLRAQMPPDAGGITNASNFYARFMRQTQKPSPTR